MTTCRHCGADDPIGACDGARMTRASLRCPDCDPAGFRAILVAKYGEPLRYNGIEIFTDPDMPKDTMADPASFAREQCPLHAGDT